MAEKKSIIKCFVTGWDLEKNEIHFDCYELGQIRLGFIKDLLYEDLRKNIFKGKNFWFEIETKPGSQIIVCKQSKKSRIKQLWNYYIKGKFDLDES